MHCSTLFIFLVLVYNINAQVIPDCGCLPSSLPLSLRKLLSQSNAPSSNSNAQSCDISTSPKKCGCPELNCNCGLSVPPVISPCGPYNPAIGLPNPIIGVQSCGCNNAFGACNCRTPVVGNLCGRTTPSVGLATTCGCSDPNVRIIDGCPNCQPIFSFNLPSLGVPTCGYPAISFQSFGGLACPSFLPSIGLPTLGLGLPYGLFPPGLPYIPATCGCNGPCTCPIKSCGCNGPCTCPIKTCGCNGPCSCPIKTCGCNGPCGCASLSSCGCNGPCTCSPVNSCGCVDIPCGLPKVKTTCTCVTPTVDTPCGRAQGKPTCACTTTVEVPTCGLPVVPPFAPVIGCTRYLRQVVVQPPFL